MWAQEEASAGPKHPVGDAVTQALLRGLDRLARPGPGTKLFQGKPLTQPRGRQDSTRDEPHRRSDACNPSNFEDGDTEERSPTSDAHDHDIPEYVMRTTTRFGRSRGENESAHGLGSDLSLCLRKLRHHFFAPTNRRAKSETPPYSQSSLEKQRTKDEGRTPPTGTAGRGT